ncbi:MAG: hypothetical protein QOH94_2712 [Mycobacterium sp.]|nr:hypothetical protein [Mycobacterium sp.]
MAATRRVDTVLPVIRLIRLIRRIRLTRRFRRRGMAGSPATRPRRDAAIRHLQRPNRGRPESSRCGR